jgi:hypothetical protein
LVLCLLGYGLGLTWNLSTYLFCGRFIEYLLNVRIIHSMRTFHNSTF